MWSMAIYLDANVLHPFRRFTELDRVALSIVAGQIKQVIFVPSVVADEAEAHYQRSLERALGRLESAKSDVRRVFDEPDAVAEPDPWVDDYVDIWRQRLGILARLLPLHGDDAIKALHREAWGIPPAKRRVDGKGEDKGGAGARDAAIWLTVARNHSTRREEGHFITGDAKDFLVEGELRPELAVDLGDASHQLHCYEGVTEFLRLLGEPTEEIEVPLNELARRVPRVLEVVLEPALHVPRAVFERIEGSRFRTAVKDAEPLRVVGARRYEGGSEALTVVDSEWRVTADCYVQPEDADDPALWARIEDVELTGTIQLYLPASPDEAVLPQIVSVWLKSDHHVVIDGEHIVVFRPAD